MKRLINSTTYQRVMGTVVETNTMEEIKVGKYKAYVAKETEVEEKRKARGFIKMGGSK